MTKAKRQRVAIALGWLLATATASAQHRERPIVPDRGMWGAGATIGLVLPIERALAANASVEGYGEYFLTPRVAVRLTAGRVAPNIKFAGREAIRAIFVVSALVYNWESGRWHPYVAGGVGAYRLRHLAAAAFPSRTKAGGYAGAGIEYFARRRVTLTGAVDLHGVPAAGFEPLSTSFVTLGVGLKLLF